MVRLVSKSLQGIITTWNKSAERVFGYTADEAVRRAITMLIPEDRLDEEPAILARIRSGERVDHFETIRRRKDGTLINISLTISPIRAGNGKIIGASKIARDISDRKRAGQHQDLLREMHHRVKNLFAITGSIITLAARTAQTPAELATGMKDRLVALSQAHEMTPACFTGGETFAEQSTTLFTILTSLLSPFEGEEEGRWRLHGEDARISASQSNPEGTAWLSLVSESVRDVRIGPAFLFLLKQRLPFGMMRLGVLPWVSAMATNVAVILLAALLIWSVGIIPFLLIHLPIVLIAGSAGVWLFYVQHQFEDTHWSRPPDWAFPYAAMHGASHYDLPRPLRWMSGNIGMHHIHHLSSRVPFYRPPEVLRDHPELADVGRISIRESLGCVKLVLWDEKRQRLISFEEM